MSDTTTTPSASETSDSASEESSTPSAEPKATNPAPSAKEKIKVDGAEEEWSPEELKKWAQMGRSAQKRYEEAAKTKKEAESVKERFKADPWGVMKELGLDPRQMSEEFLVKILQDEQMTPEERARAAEKAELERYKSKDKEREEAEAKVKQQAEVDREISRIDAELSKALTDSDLPKTPGVIRAIAKKLFDALEDGSDMSVEEAVALTEEEWASDYAEAVKASRNPRRYVPDDIAKKLMGDHLSQVKGAPRYSQESTPEGAKPAESKRISSSDFMKKIMS